MNEKSVEEGCTHCGGDCSAANSPVIGCPERDKLASQAKAERYAALARVAKLEHALRVVVNAADHGSWPTTVMHGIEKVREVLAGSAPPAKAQHSVPEEFIGRLSEFLAQRGATGKALLRELRDMLAAAPGKEESHE